jgi:flagellar biosynthesis protein FlhG
MQSLWTAPAPPAEAGTLTQDSDPEPAAGGGGEDGGAEIWAVGGGKGGTGKTLVAANLAVHLARWGERVVAVDADLGGANLHTALGMAPPRSTLSDFLHRRVATLDEAAVETEVENLRLVSGARNSLDADALPFFQKEKLLRHLRGLRCDRVIVDLGAGSSLATLDLFCAAHVPVVVSLPEPTSVENLYRFLKAAFLRRLARSARAQRYAAILEWVARHRRVSGVTRPADLVREVEGVDAEAGAWMRGSLSEFRPALVISQARHGVDAQLGESIEVACRSFLGIEVEFLGTVPYDVCLPAALKAGYPYLTRHFNQPAGARLMQIAEALRARRAAQAHRAEGARRAAEAQQAAEARRAGAAGGAERAERAGTAGLPGGARS